MSNGTNLFNEVQYGPWTMCEIKTEVTKSDFGELCSQLGWRRPDSRKGVFASVGGRLPQHYNSRTALFRDLPKVY
jgi:hypothetical protein